MKLAGLELSTGLYNVSVGNVLLKIHISSFAVCSPSMDVHQTDRVGDNNLYIKSTHSHGILVFLSPSIPYSEANADSIFHAPQTPFVEVCLVLSLARTNE